MLLDVMLPGMDGWQVCREVRKISNIPIIMLTAKDETFDKVLGLELGADDYIVKPFDMKELVARIKAVHPPLSGGRGAGEGAGVPRADHQHQPVHRHLHGQAVGDAAARRSSFCYFLASHPGMVFTREQLLEQVWGYDYFGDSRTVDVHVKRLREKLSGGEELGWQIKTVWGVGYKFEVK